MGKTIIPHSRPTVGKEEADAAAKVIKSGLIAQGDKVREFEEKLASFVGVKGAVVTNSGTSAMHLGLAGMGISETDELLLPSYVCTAPMNAVYLSGATPMICDVDMDNYNISLESITGRKTLRAKGVIVPHMFGNTADLEMIEKTGVPVIEDCAQSIGAKYGDRMTGSMGEFSIFSFYANKMMACGEGGAILSNNSEILKRAEDMRDYDGKDDYILRYNYKMTDIQAAVGIVQLDKVPRFISRRKEIAAKYNEAFKNLDIILPKHEFDMVYYRYVIRIEKDPREFISAMADKAIRCERPVYKPLHRYFELRSGFRNTDEVFSKAISIPVYPSLTDDEVEKIIDAVKKRVK